MRTATEAAPSFAAATPWFAPLPPGLIRKSDPNTVSPAAGSRFVLTAKSIFRLPTTTTTGFIYALTELPAGIDAEFLQLFRIVAFLQDVPLFAAFGNIALDGPHFIPRRTVGFLLNLQDFRKCLHDFQPRVVLILLQPQVAGFLQRHNQFVRNIRDLVARKLHRIARVAPRRLHDLALLHQRVLGFTEHLLVADALAPHIVA